MFFRFSKFVLLALVPGIIILLSSHNDEENLKELLKTYRENTPSERLFLHIDKELYQPGDTLWFSAYNLDYRKREPSFTSNFLFISLINNEGNEVLYEKFYLSKAKAKGDILIPPGLEDGEYTILAYTSWMKKGNPKNIFNKIISIRESIPAPFSFKTLLNDSVFTAGDNLIMEVIAETPGNKVLSNLRISWEASASGKIFEKGKTATNDKGSAKIEFVIPGLPTPSSLLLQLEAEFMETARQAIILIPLSGSALNIDFLPEGGSFVAGVENTLAFKAMNGIGEPVEIAGFVEDDKGSVIVDSAFSIYKGMGRFTILPEITNRYHFVVNQPKIYAGKYSLPNPDSAGITLQTSNQGNQVKLIVKASDSNHGMKGLILCGIMNDNLIFEQPLPDNSNSFFSTVQTTELPAGIIRFCVMMNKQSILERRVFVNPEKVLRIELTPERKRYRTRERVDLDILVTDHNNQPVEGSFSLSIANNQRFYKDGAKSLNINSWFLLSSELTGDIPEPDFYFSGNTGSADALDLVMLINGWRGFTWEEVVRVQQQNDFLNLNPEALRGKVETMKGKPVKNANVTLLNTKIFGVEQTTTDREGHFSYSPSRYMMLNMNDMTLSAETSSGNKNVQVFIENPFHDSLLALYRFDVENPGSESEEVEENLINIELDQPIRSFENPVNITWGYFEFEEVSVTAGKQVIEVGPEERSETVMKLEKEGEDLSPANSSNFVDILRQIDPGFNISDGGKVLFRGNNSLYERNQSGALFVLNGVPVGDNINQLDFIEPSSIDKIVITKNASAALKYRGGYLSGLIEITTKDDIVYKQTDQNLREKNITTIHGFRLSRSFYSPDYSKLKRNTFPDLRSTVYWNPEIKTDSNGRAKVTFYNPDVRSGITGFMEGWSNNGRSLGTGKVFYEIY